MKAGETIEIPKIDTRDGIAIPWRLLFLAVFLNPLPCGAGVDSVSEYPRTRPPNNHPQTAKPSWLMLIKDCAW